VDLSGFDARFGEAVAAARALPLAGLAPSDSPVMPNCQALAGNARGCSAAFPANEPVVLLTAISSGSIGASGMMFVAAEFPDGIEGTKLAAPTVGDEALLARTWGQGGCSAVLAVRDGTLVLSVRVMLTRDAATTDCKAAAPAEYLETAARGLLDALAEYPSLGLPVDDLAARDRVVDLITSGKLRPGERDIVTLPAEFAGLSDGGEVIATRQGDDWTIVFFEARGVIDHYTGWVFRSSGKLGADEDPLAGGDAIVERINPHWFHVASS
jgi:hypothetical protein